MLLSKSYLKYLSLSSLFLCEEQNRSNEIPCVPCNTSQTSVQEMATCIST